MHQNLTLIFFYYHYIFTIVVRIRKIKEAGNYQEAVAVKQDGWAAEDSDEEGSFIFFLNFYMNLIILYYSFIRFFFLFFYLFFVLFGEVISN